jgi:DNA-binding LacI/PurR family transcriptional regulator
LVTIRDVAREAGVSTATVSYVINNCNRVGEKTRERVLKVIDELNYYPSSVARALAIQKSNTIAIVVPRTASVVFSDIFFTEALATIAEGLSKEGYTLSLLVGSETDDGVDYNTFIRKTSADGIIVIGPKKDDSAIPHLQFTGVPLVGYGRIESDEPIPYVDVDLYQGVLDILDYLVVKKGHKKVAFINGPEYYCNSIDQKRGYLDGSSKYCLEIDDGWMRNGDFIEGSGYREMVELLKLSNRPTALIIASNPMAIGAMKAIKEKGLQIPQDISIVSITNLSISEYVDPALTVLDTATGETGLKVVEVLVGLLRGQELETGSIILQPSLIERASA